MLACAACGARAAETPRNWFDDPFFRVRAGYAGCPEPRGPRSTREEMLRETHHRSERGTRCWLEKRCARSSAYAYDRDIAAAMRSRFDATREFHDASLWITVRGRYVWVEGCVRSARERRSLEAFVRGVPDVDLTTVNVVERSGAKPPYYPLY